MSNQSVSKSGSKTPDLLQLSQVMAYLRENSRSFEDVAWRSANTEISAIPGFMHRAARNTSPSSESTVWNPSDVGYFIPDNTSYEHHYCHEGVLFFSNVFAFIKHIRGIAVHRPEEIIRDNIQTCFRGKALDWYDIELSDDEKGGLTCLSPEQGWYKYLIQRFQPRCDVAFDKYQYAEYSVDCAWACNDPVEWAHSVMRDAEAMVSPPSIRDQLRHIWRAIDQDLKWPIHCPEQDTSVSLFMKELDDAYQEWCHYNQDEQKT